MENTSFLKYIKSDCIVLDEKFLVRDVSEHMTNRYKCSKSIFVGKHYVDIVEAEDTKLLIQRLSEFAQSNKMHLTMEFPVFQSQYKTKNIMHVNISKVDWEEVRYILQVSENSHVGIDFPGAGIELLKYKKLEQIAKIGIWEFDIQSNKLYWSDEVYRIHKVLKGDDILLEQAKDFYQTEDKETFSKLIQKSIEEGVSWSRNLRIINREDELVWVEVRGQAVFDQEGRPTKITGTIRDITEAIQMQKLSARNISLAASYQLIIDDFAIVAKTDLDGKINYVNEQFCKISQYQEHELIGENHRILNSGHHPKEFWDQFWTTIQSGRAFRADICNMAKDGSLYWVDSFISPLNNSKGEIEGFMAVRVDISAKKEMEAEINIQKERQVISAQLAAVGEMSAGIAHEINNPLAVIKGSVEVLYKKIERGNLDNIESKKNTIMKAISRINSIIKGLKRVSHRSDSEEFVKTSMEEIMNDTLEFSDEVLRSRGIKLIVEDIPSCLIWCHPVQISQVLLNLINNARDAIADLDEKWIKVQTFQMHDKLKINIIDSGKGIDEALQQKIMENFFTTKGLGKGTGLGLSLSKRIIEEHGGKLVLDSDCENTCFSIYLPIIEE